MNVPQFNEGEVRVTPGPIMAQVTVIEITVHGKGGHASLPHLTQDVITAGSFILTNLHTVKSRCINSKENFVFTITNFDSGFTHNVMPDKAYMQGTIRSYNKEVLAKIKEKINLIANTTAQECIKDFKLADTYGCVAEVKFNDMYPAVINHAKETAHIQRIATQHLGGHLVKDSQQQTVFNNKICYYFQDADLPLTASEDFSFFLEEKPGCFFMLGIKKPSETVLKTLHTSTYDFNDDMIAYGGYFYGRLVEDRLGVKIFDQ